MGGVAGLHKGLNLEQNAAMTRVCGVLWWLPRPYMKLPPSPPNKMGTRTGAHFIWLSGSVDEPAGSTSEHCSRRMPKAVP